MADQLPETPYKRSSKEERNKERVERQKLLVSLPRSKPEQSMFALVSERVAELREMQEDVLLLLAAEDLNAQKATLVQHLRSLGAKTAKLLKVSTIAAKEGSATAQRLFIPAPAYPDLDDEESKALEKIRKEQEAAKKKESAKSESSWKMFNAKKTAPYAYNYGKPSYGGGFGGYGGGASGLGSWALQQLLSQQLNQGASGSGKQKNGGGGPSAAAGSSGVQDGNYAARMAANRLQYPCNGCGVLGHWKRDGECNPADVAKYIKRKMEEQAKKDDEEEGEDTGMNIYLAEYFY